MKKKKMICTLLLSASVLINIGLTPTIDIYASILSQPQDVTLQEGTSDSFTVVCDDANATYQWQVDRHDGRGFVNVSGSNQATHTTMNMSKKCDGYEYRCVIVAGDETQISEPATLHVLTASEMAALSNDSNSVDKTEAGETDTNSTDINNADKTDKNDADEKNDSDSVNGKDAQNDISDTETNDATTNVDAGNQEETSEENKVDEQDTSELNAEDEMRTHDTQTDGGMWRPETEEEEQSTSAMLLETIGVAWFIGIGVFAVLLLLWGIVKIRQHSRKKLKDNRKKQK